MCGEVLCDALSKALAGILTLGPMELEGLGRSVTFGDGTTTTTTHDFVANLAQQGHDFIQPKGTFLCDLETLGWLKTVIEARGKQRQGIDFSVVYQETQAKWKEHISQGRLYLSSLFGETTIATKATINSKYKEGLMCQKSQKKNGPSGAFSFPRKP